MISLIIMKFCFESNLNDGKPNLGMTDSFNINKCKSEAKIKICLCISDLKCQLV